METERVLGVALESPVHWVRIVCPKPESSGKDPALPGSGSPLLLTFSRTRLPEGNLFCEFVASPAPELEPWFESSPWGPGAKVEVERHAALVSLVGEGVVSSGDILRRAEDALRRAGLPLWASHTGSLSHSLLVPEDSGEAAARALHAEFVRERSA